MMPDSGRWCVEQTAGLGKKPSLKRLVANANLVNFSRRQDVQVRKRIQIHPRGRDVLKPGRTAAEYRQGKRRLCFRRNSAQ